jgi:hypothetical protein
MGGVFNIVNLHAYHYAGNNPVKYTDPDGEEQTPAQTRQTRVYSEISNGSSAGNKLIKSNTVIVVTRNYYEGVDIGGNNYYKDNLSIRVLGNELNNIQVQSTVDWTNKYDASDAPSNFSHFDAEIGVSGDTNPLIRDTIRIDDRGNFFHKPVRDNDRPFGGGCAIPRTEADEREVMNILRNDLGFKNGEKVEWRYTINVDKNHENLK